MFFTMNYVTASWPLIIVTQTDIPLHELKIHEVLTVTIPGDGIRDEGRVCKEF